MANGMLAMEDALSGINDRLDSIKAEQDAAAEHIKVRPLLDSMDAFLCPLGARRRMACA